MKQKLLTTLLLGIFLITIASAITIYSGEESEQINLGEQYEYYSVVGNQSPINLNITNYENNNITITLDKYSQEDSFEIIFFNKEKEIITVYQPSGGGSSGGGGGGTKTIYKDKEINIMKYIDREVEVPTEVEVEVEKIVNKLPSWMRIIFIIGLVILLVIILLIILLITVIYKNKKEVKK